MPVTFEECQKAQEVNPVVLETMDEMIKANFDGHESSFLVSDFVKAVNSKLPENAEKYTVKHDGKGVHMIFRSYNHPDSGWKASLEDDSTRLLFRKA